MPGTGVEYCLAHQGKQSLGTVLRTWTNSRHVAQESSHMGWTERDQKRLFKAGRHFSWGQTPSTGDYIAQKCRGRERGIDRIMMMMIKIIRNLF